MIVKHSRTAGLTSEQAVKAIGNRFDLILVAARRLRELNRGDARLINSRHSNAVAVIEEIEQGKVTRDYMFKHIDPEAPRRRKGRRQ